MSIRWTKWATVVSFAAIGGCAVQEGVSAAPPPAGEEDSCAPAQPEPAGPCAEPGPDDAPSPASMADSPRERIAIGDAPRLGPPGAPVTIVFAADLECDYCAKAWITMRRLQEAYGDHVTIVFKHHPLPSHLHAVDAAVALEAAGRLGKFWEMADLLFAHQDRLDRPSFVADAQRLGLDAGEYEAALDDPRTRARVHADRGLLDSVGARGAPTFWINGRRLVGAYPLATFRSLIDEELGGS